MELKNKYVVIKHDDLKKHVKKPFRHEFWGILNLIEEGRKEDGKNPTNEYVVINRDEPYIDEVLEIMNKHHKD